MLLTAYLTDDHAGFCARLTRQTSQLVGSGQYPRYGGGGGYSKRSTGYYPARATDQEYYPVEYSDEISLDQQMLEDLLRENHEAKRTRDVLKIIAVDKRPKCQPIGAQVDCR